MARLRIYRESTFNGYEIIDECRRNSKKKNVREFYLHSLEKIYALGMYSQQVMSRPRAFHYTFSFTEKHSDYSITEVINRIKDAYEIPKKGKIDPVTGKLKHSRKQENTFKPLFYWCRELSHHPDHPLKGHIHYHLMLILCRSKGQIGAAKVVIDQLRKDGIIKTANISKDNDESTMYGEEGKKRKAFASVLIKKDFARYMYWFSYIAKVETRMEGRSCDSSRIPKPSES